ncbi:MAG: phage tail tape measure protein, partial [Bacilli bacterium]|nr:phage tail tape measure protein [Bacilli bacterium]
TTIKLANVSRQSAQEVSDEMTAIWNNFYDGSRSLEYYADVITALGAATASSSEEISTGLEKFAAVSKTVGLSYEYATSALATITATTRQSADTVGTGLRTLFSRLEGLKLGETLEDGVDLNKYSQALESVGVQVLDVSGELRNMDDILDDLGERWGELSQAQKMALAQTVGGVRQYTNLIALMDNWDFMQQNLGVAQGAEGTLQEQADIYAESWEAAQKRVKAAAQSIYQDLLNDDFFITLLNTFAKIISGIDSVIDSMGGLKGVLWGIGALISQVYSESMAKGIDNMIFNIQRGTDAFKAQQEQFRQEAIDAAARVNADGSNLGEAKVSSLQHQIQLQQELRSVADSLSADELERLQYEIDIVKQLDEQVEAAAKLKDEATKSMSDVRSDLLRQNARENKGKTGLIQGTEMTDKEALQGLQELETLGIKAQKSFEDLNAKFEKGEISLQKYRQNIGKLATELANSGIDKNGSIVEQFNKALQAAGNGTNEFNKYLSVLKSEGGLATDVLIDIDKYADELAQQFGWDAKELEVFRTAVRNFVNSGMTMEQAIQAAGNEVEAYSQKVAQAKAATETLGTTGQTITKAFSGISQVMMGLNALGSIIDTLKNPDLSGWEKFTKVMMSLGMGVPMVVTGLGNMIKLYKDLNNAVIKVIAAKTAETGIESKNLVVKYAAITADKLKLLIQRLQNGESIKTIALEGL